VTGFITRFNPSEHFLEDFFKTEVGWSRVVADQYFMAAASVFSK
jgi:hypothetical protein